MSRVPAKPRDELTPEQQEVSDKFYAISEKSFGPNGEKFIWKDDKDAVIGPFPFFIHAPAVGNIIHSLFAAFAKLPIPGDARETAIMTTGGHFQGGYETYSHIPQAVAAGLSQEQAEVLSKGVKKPEGFNERCDAAYEVTRYLMTQRGPLPQELWDRSVKAIGQDGTVGLLHYIGFYSYVCVALNGVDAPVPE